VLATVVTLRRYVPADCDATVEIFLRAIREVASRGDTPRRSKPQASRYWSMATRIQLKTAR